MIKTKRWNDPVEPDDGYRLLVCRYRPRGVRRDDEAWDAWLPQLGPSRELHAAVYGKTRPAISWEAYSEAYVREMRTQRFFIRGFAERVAAGETLTLLCSSACTDPERCHRTLLAALIGDAAREIATPKQEPAVTRPVVRRRPPPGDPR